MKEFLNEVAGQTLLRLVSRGSAIIAELLRLSAHVPAVFRLDDPAMQRKYGNILFDFKYLTNSDLYETRIEQSADLIDIDQEFRENHLEILRRFYLLFESIFKYIKDFRHYLQDLEAGVFIQLTLEIILMNGDGKQLMAESLYLYGVMLILLDSRIEGIVRERMLISYLRYKGQTELPHIDDVCMLCRSTGHSGLPGTSNAGASSSASSSSSSSDKKGAKDKYPDDYFARFPVPAQVVSMVIGRLRSDDIYNMTAAFPLPEHRSTALATQAQMLYVILYFAPDILHNQQAVMREIVDKHFPDNWVLAYYLGFTVDLSVAWDSYRAAKMALANTITLPNVQSLTSKFWARVITVRKEVRAFLVEGVLVEEYILDNIPKLLACLREANVTLRWLMLHTNASNNKKLRDLVSTGSESGKVSAAATAAGQTFLQDDVLALLLDLGQLEYVLKNVFQALLDSKQAKWQEYQKQGSERMTELGEYFSGEKALTRVKKNEHLQNWFLEMGRQIGALDYGDSTTAGRKMQQLIQALVEVEQFHQIESSLQVKQFLIDTRQFLYQMIRIVNVKEEVLITLGLVADISYAWDIIDNYVDLMQKGIKNDPGLVLKLRSTFLKLASILDLPLVRINQAQSNDLMSVSEYYSTELVQYVRKVLEIVPKSMFIILKQIINMQTKEMQELPTKVEKERLRDFAQLDQRFELARATHAISVFTEGILAMETTLVGIIKVDPKQLLEDGIRKELVQQIAFAMDRTLVFNTKGSSSGNNKIDDTETKLRDLGTLLDGFRRSFQYIQDYVNIQGLKIWQEEFSRIVNFYVEQECNSFLKKKTYDWQSQYQNSAIPIPLYSQPIGSESVNFIGRLARELLAQTTCKSTIYLDQMSAWYEPSTGRELVGIRTMSILLRSVGVFGITGLDKLLSFMIVKDLQTFVGQIRSATERTFKGFLAELENVLNPTTTIPTNTQKLYMTALARTKPMFALFLDTVARIGQMQLLRRQIANLLNFTSKLDSNALYCALDTANKSLITDVEMHYVNPDAKPYPSEDSPLLSDLSRYLETAGINDPYTKIYITTLPLDGFPCLMFLSVVGQLGRFEFNNALNAVVPKKGKDAYDWQPFVVGVVTLLKQFHALHTQKFLAYIGQYIRGLMNVNLNPTAKDIGKESEATGGYPEDVIPVLLFVEEFCRVAHLSRKAVEGAFPAYILDNFKH
eukprot:TRINITY_DN759_c0_g1_i3.p1 TRINITY_DN759_c0_g1~~TRINITY_DN759_c0_g1_i3.p1  ORF type:complete len:1198 (+),score=276.33 TRINITY_DN759_c0_g1_i3:52-3645(+)